MKLIHHELIQDTGLPKLLFHQVFKVRHADLGSRQAVTSWKMAMDPPPLQDASGAAWISKVRPAFAEGLIDAQFSQELLPNAPDELGALAPSPNTMASRIRERVNHLSVEFARREAILANIVEGVIAVDQDCDGNGEKGAGEELLK